MSEFQRAKSLRLKAERRLGEILRDMPKSTGAMGSGSNQHEVRLHNDTAPPTLAEIGIDKRTSSRAQKLAAHPEKTFAAVASGDMPITAHENVDEKKDQMFSLIFVFRIFSKLGFTQNLPRFCEKSSYLPANPRQSWRPQGDSNPCTHRERVMS